jgi:hypothetical protein
MAEYLPVNKPGQALVSTASAAIVGGVLVAVSGDGTVAPAGAATQAWVGVAAFDAASGDRVTVHAGGVQELTASGAITAGAAVVSGAAGTVASSATPAAATQVGVALTTAADGAKVRVKLAR